MNQQYTSRRSPILICVIALLGTIALSTERAQGQDPIAWTMQSGVITTVPALQAVRINMVRTDNGDIQPCIVEVRFFNSLGQPFGPVDYVDLQPGVSATRVLFGAGSTSPVGYRFQLKSLQECASLVTTTEIYERRNGATQFMHPGLVRRPIPDSE